MLDMSGPALCSIVLNVEGRPQPDAQARSASAVIRTEVCATDDRIGRHILGRDYRTRSLPQQGATPRFASA